MPFFWVYQTTNMKLSQTMSAPDSVTILQATLLSVQLIILIAFIALAIWKAVKERKNR